MDQRDFITGILRDMEGNATLARATGRGNPTPDTPLGKLKVEDFRWYAYPAELDLMVADAEAWAEEGVDAYLSPIIYGSMPYVDRKDNVIPKDRRGRPLYSRSKRNALLSQTVYMDSDLCPPDKFRLTPSRHVDTSHGHGHDYWFLLDPVPAEEAAEVAHRITTAHKADGSDPSGWSMNKVLRLPTVNTSYDPDFPYSITYHDTGEIYDLLDISGAYDDVEVVSVPDHAPGPLAPVPQLASLPDFETLVSRIPATEARLNDLIYKNPKGGPDGWRSEQRYALLLDLRRFGFTEEETVAVAWHSPAASKWREDERGVDGLWWELQHSVEPVIAEEKGLTVSTAPKRAEKAKGPKLLKPAEREFFEKRSDMVTLYQEWARSQVQVYNGPYHQGNAWVLLALALSEVAYIPRGGSKMPCNLYMMQLGPSSSGKTEAKDLLHSCNDALFPHDNPDIGGEHSKNAFIEQLIDRDGKVSWLNEDEADGRLEEIKHGGWTSGIQQTWTYVYDGRVPPLGRVGKKDLAQAGRRSIVTQHFMGTPHGMMAVLDRSMFKSGWLARQIWVIGEDIPVTEETLKSKFGTAASQAHQDAMPKYLASVFNRLRSRARMGLAPGQTQIAIVPTEEARERFDKAKVAIHKHFEKMDDYADIWSTVTRRMFDIILKAAALTALSYGRKFIAERDVVVALGYAEIWLDTAIVIVDGISDTLFSKQCDDIESFIASKPDEEAELGAIYRYRKGERTAYVEEYLTALVKQGRIYDSTVKGKPTTYRIKRNRNGDQKK